jgi:hypothetical protein
MNENANERTEDKSPTLREAIVHAFSNNVYPGDDRLTVYDPAGRECDETFQLLRGKTWQECPVAEFLRGDTPIPDLTPEAFCYYMPAMLIASIGDSDVAGDVCGSVCFFLSPSSARCTEGELYLQYDHTEEYMRRMGMFTKHQRNVMIRVLEEYVARGWESTDSAAQTIAFLRSLDVD